MSCQPKPTFSSTQDQALHISPLPASSASSPTTSAHTLSDPPAELPVIPAHFCLTTLLSAAGWRVVGAASPASAGLARSLGPWEPPVQASVCGTCCAAMSQTACCLPSPGPLEARTVPHSPVCPQGLTELGTKLVVAKSDHVKERGSLPSTVSHYRSLASLCNY